MIKKYSVSIVTFIALVGVAVGAFYALQPTPVTGNNNPLLKDEFWQTATPADVEKIIEAGADVNALGELKKTPLMIAAQHTNNPETLIVLLNNNADRTLWSAEQKRAVNYAMDNPKVKGTKVFKAINNPLFSTSSR